MDFTTKNRKKIEIKEDGIYVITGGLGGVGLVMANYLAQKGRVNLALISRTGVPRGKEQQDYLRKIMTTGTRVECIAGDCTDFRRMDKIMKGLRQKYGRINGIIHGAGIIEVDTLINRSEKEFLSVLSPKIEGTFILDRVTEEENLDFFILFSSVATVFPTIGQSDYAAANMYLNAYSQYRNKKNRNTLTINWVAWKDVGMAVSTGISQGFIFKALPIDKAMKGFDKVIQYPISNVLIGEINYSDNIVSLLEKYPVSLSLDIKENLNQKKEESSASKKSKAAVGTSVRLAGREDNNYTETEKILAAIWGKILGFEELDIFASFYALGGDSILALRIINNVNSEFNINLNISELLNYVSIASLAEMLDRDYPRKHRRAPDSIGEKATSYPLSLQQKRMYSMCNMPVTYLVEGEIDAVRADFVYDFLEPVEKREYYPASSAQKRLFFLNQLTHIGISYNLPVIVKVKGKFDKNRFENAIRELIEYHEALRTSFQLVDNELMQKVHDKVDFKVNYIQTNKSTLQEGDISQLAKELIQPFDLSIAPLFRIALITTLSEEEHLILYDLHHIIADGTSIQIFNAGFMRLYKGEKLSPLRIQYKDYTCWQNKLLETEQIKAQERYWLDVFSGEIPKLDLPTDFPRPSIFTFKGDTCLFKLGYEDTQLLKKMCAECSVTLFMNILAAFYVLLHKYTNQEDIIVGYGIGGRSHKDLQPIMGMFINTLAMRNQPRPQKTYKEFLDEVRENCLQAYKNQDIQFERLIDKIDLQRDPSRTPLFDVSIVIQNFERSRERIEENIFHEYYFEKKTSMVDLTLFINEIDNEIHFTFEYYSAIFKQETIQRLSNYLVNIIKQVCKNSQIPILDIDILCEEEKSQLLHTFNRTKAYYPEDKTINELFEQQVAKAPEAVALTFQAQQLSYSGLNARANQLARVLRQKGVRPGSIVGMLFERSTDMIVGILGILKSGGAYLPIDPGYPLERISYMLKDSKVKIVLTQKDYPFSDNLSPVDILPVDNEGMYSREACNPEIINTPDDLAYIIYTSGTTGEPKGTMIEHRDVVNLIWALKERVYRRYENCLKVSLLVSYTFDASVQQIFGALLQGHSLHLVPEGIRADAAGLLNFYTRNEIDIAEATPAHVRLLLDHMRHSKFPLRVKHFFIGGEALPRQIVKDFFHCIKENTPDTEQNVPIISNVYGPTECCVVSTSYEITTENIDHYESIPIGRPILNKQIHIVNKENRLQPIGVVGEICVSGHGLSRGYLNKPDLIAEKFIDNPYAKGCKLYKTGDLGRWLPDGNIEFIGRIDNQVKIRGLRIELGEIEAHLLRTSGIKEAAVLAKEADDGQEFLYAYIISDKSLTMNELREHLSKNLPNYMVPSYFIQLEQLPLTSNGKIDRKKLESCGQAMMTGVQYVAPENELQERIAAIWGKILKLDKVGIHDNFFDLGGNSLNIIQVNDMLKKELSREISVTSLFQYPTVNSLARFLNNLEENQTFSDRKEILGKGMDKLKRLKNKKISVN
ncbi:MAG: amino acid adenylation domain-containing protein [bacterium]